MLIGFTSYIFFLDFFFFLIFVCKIQSNLCLHTTFLQSLIFFNFFLAAACSLDKEEESKPLCLLKTEPDTLKETK